VGVVTALSPYIGYTAAAGFAHSALVTGKSIRELVVASAMMTAEEAAEALSPERLTGLHEDGRRDR
jgi:aspartate ammonia-lyase